MKKFFIKFKMLMCKVGISSLNILQKFLYILPKILAVCYVFEAVRAMSSGSLNIGFYVFMCLLLAFLFWSSKISLGIKSHNHVYNFKEKDNVKPVPTVSKEKMNELQERYGKYIKEDNKEIN